MYTIYWLNKPKNSRISSKNKKNRKKLEILNFQICIPRLYLLHLRFQISQTIIVQFLWQPKIYAFH